MFDPTAFPAADKIHEPWTGHDTQTLVMAAIGIAIVVLLARRRGNLVFRRRRADRIAATATLPR
ncbi:hypothetical protein [Saccharopolyspora shandongensis]|uniref:hypothetical protein n=1 Tax=Saccharopolyspora shandongensis TaxID=418495 RepID=UPI0034057933